MGQLHLFKIGGHIAARGASRNNYDNGTFSGLDKVLCKQVLGPYKAHLRRHLGAKKFWGPSPNAHLNYAGDRRRHV